MNAGRSYAGEAPEDRSARRRRQLLDAGLELFGTVGYRRTTVRALCREGRVADRNFYEEFDSTQALLLAVYHSCLDRLQAAVVQATAAPPGPTDVRTLTERGLDAFFACVESDHRLARVVWFEVLGVSAQLEAAHLRRMDEFGEMLVAVLAKRELIAVPESAQRRVVLLALVGGISQTALAWVSADYRPARAELVAPLTAFVLAGAALSPPDAAPGSTA